MTRYDITPTNEWNYSSVPDHELTQPTLQARKVRQNNENEAFGILLMYAVMLGFCIVAYPIAAIISACFCIVSGVMLGLAPEGIDLFIYFILALVGLGLGMQLETRLAKYSIYWWLRHIYRVLVTTVIVTAVSYYVSPLLAIVAPFMAIYYAHRSLIRKRVR